MDLPRIIFMSRIPLPANPNKPFDPRSTLIRPVRLIQDSPNTVLVEASWTDDALGAPVWQRADALKPHLLDYLVGLIFANRHVGEDLLDAIHPAELADADEQH